MPGRPRRTQIYRRLDQAIAELHDRLGGLPDPAEAEAIWTTIWYREARNPPQSRATRSLFAKSRRSSARAERLATRRSPGTSRSRGTRTRRNASTTKRFAPGAWSEGSLLTLTEVRQVDQLALGPVWHVAPHPNASGRESPGSFREHDIAPVPGGMTPPSWTDVPAEMRDWLRAMKRTPRRLATHRGPGRRAQSLRAHSPVPRWQRPRRPAAAQPAARPPRLHTGDDLRARPAEVPPRSAGGRLGRRRSSQ